jgi:hypothetical protein
MTILPKPVSRRKKIPQKNITGKTQVSENSKHDYKDNTK